MNCMLCVLPLLLSGLCTVIMSGPVSCYLPFPWSCILSTCHKDLVAHVPGDQYCMTTKEEGVR